MREKSIFIYETPTIITYSKEDVIEELGPAQACAPSPCPVTP